MDCYEDMFKEITRKLYGTEDGLSTTASANNPSNTSPVTTNSSMEQRPSGTNGQRYEEQQQSLAPPFLKEETLTAFGLAALMQTSFPPAAAAMSGYTPQGHHYPHHLSGSPTGQSQGQSGQSQLHQNHLPINIPPPPQPTQQASEPPGHVDRSVSFNLLWGYY